MAVEQVVEVVEVVEVEVEMVEAEGTPHLARVCRAPLDANVEHLGRGRRRHARAAHLVGVRGQGERLGLEPGQRTKGHWPLVELGAAHVAQPEECEAARGADGLRVTQHL